MGHLNRSRGFATAGLDAESPAPRAAGDLWTLCRSVSSGPPIICSGCDASPRGTARATFPALQLETGQERTRPPGVPRRKPLRVMAPGGGAALAAAALLASAGKRPAQDLLACLLLSS